jgi:hypothetical protein
MGATRDALFTHNGTAYHLAVVDEIKRLYNMGR